MSGYIEVTPGVAGGKPRIAGRRITAQDVVWHERLGLSADEALATELRTRTPSKLRARLGG